MKYLLIMVPFAVFYCTVMAFGVAQPWDAGLDIEQSVDIDSKCKNTYRVFTSLEYRGFHGFRTALEEVDGEYDVPESKVDSVLSAQLMRMKARLVMMDCER